MRKIERTDMKHKFKLLSGIYKTTRNGDNKAYEGYGVVNENNNPYAFLSWHTQGEDTNPVKVKISIATDIGAIDDVPREYVTTDMPTLGEGVYRIKRIFAQLTIAN